MLRACTLQNGAIGVVFYFLSLILSLSIANIDDKINLSQDDNRLSTLWDSDQVNSTKFHEEITRFFVQFSNKPFGEANVKYFFLTVLAC